MVQDCVNCLMRGLEVVVTVLCQFAYDEVVVAWNVVVKVVVMVCSRLGVCVGARVVKMVGKGGHHG